MLRWTQVGVIFIMITVALSGCFAMPQTQHEAGETNKYVFIGQEVSKFEVKDYNGNSIDNSIFKDHDITMINFWSPNCKPCLEELPEIQSLYKKLAQKDIGLLTICVDGSNKDLQNLLKTYEMEYPVILLDNQKMMKECLKDFEYIPFTVFVDREGRYIDKFIIGSQTEKEYLEAIEALKKSALGRYSGL